MHNHGYPFAQVGPFTWVLNLPQAVSLSPSIHSMEVDCYDLESKMEGVQDEYAVQALSPCSSGTGDTFGEPEVLPRVGDEYQVEIPPLIAECERLQLIPRDSGVLDNNKNSFTLGLAIPLTWANIEIENINGTVDYENSEQSQITSCNEYPQLKVEVVNTGLHFGEDVGMNLQLQRAAGGDKMEIDLQLSQETDTKLDPMERVVYPLPGCPCESWTDTEQNSFLLGLYVFGKNLSLVKRFVESKEMGAILSFYYGKFYRSEEYLRWSRCRKLRSRRTIHGEKIFTGWRQQELLSRLSSHVPQECQSVLLEASRTFGEGKLSFEDYVFTLKSAVGINLLVEAVSVGKGKKDLTGFAMESVKPNHTISVRPEMPVGKAWSSLTCAEIIKFLTGNFRLSKARSNDLFWEAVWPRLLARGWHSEQPKDHGLSGTKHSLVFLVPGVRKFSRRRLVKGNHYFDSVSDVLNKVSSDPGLLELETESDKSSQDKEVDELHLALKQSKDDLSNKKPQCYLQPRYSNCKRDTPKFTIVDTSLCHGAVPSKVRELRSLPLETSMSTLSSISSESEEDTSEESQEDAEVTNTTKAEEDVTDQRTCLDSSDYTNNPLNIDKPNVSNPSVDVDSHNNDRKGFANRKRPRRTVKNQSSRKAKSRCSKYLVPITKQQGFIANDQGESSFGRQTISANKKLVEDESHCTSSLCQVYEQTVFQVLPLQNLSSDSPLAKASPDGSDEGIVDENCPCRELPLEDSQSPKLIDLNVPHVPPDSLANEPRMTDAAENKDNSCVSKASLLSETSHQPEQSRLRHAAAPEGEKPGRRQSTRNRPLTMRALEAMELGLMNLNKKRKGSTSERKSISRTSRQTRRKTNVKGAPDDVTSNNDGISRTGEFMDELHDNNDMVGESRA